ncbi:PREDICTED: BTB/POZ domain-containing protein 3 isoform X1 [Bactrocera latifrons]|uniref:BTB/POZ domain-containing protein 3 isoform X1 n=2 Tax=Bactrocera latifrons TaxID=174628 RepID=UPI0008DCE802|nr:PREDICTED: BTB/POZ domain-containing protein 3 isoform X1 [Bactrocera latifrons]
MFCKRLPNSKERRMRLLQDDQHLSDCEFLVGDSPDKEPQRFRCHKMILASASEVFERMFYSEFNVDGPVRVIEVDAKSFERFLRYVYIYEIETEENLSLKELCELLYLADKYMMQDLTDELVKHLKQKHNWTISDVWPIFDLACLYENLPLLLLCYEKITKSVVTLLSVDSFYELNANHLKRVVILVSQQPHISTKLMLQRLEEYGRRNKLHENRESEQFFKLVEAACLLDFNKLSKADYESGLRQSYLFNKK